MHACDEVTIGTEVPVSSTRGLWFRRLLILLGFLAGAWVLVMMSDQQRAEAAPTPPVRPVLASLVASAPVPVAPAVDAVLTPVTAVGTEAVDHLSATAARVGATARHASAPVVSKLVRSGTTSHRLPHVPQVRHTARGHKIRHGAPPPVSPSTRLGAAHRVVILSVPSTPHVRVLVAHAPVQKAATRAPAPHRTPVTPLPARPLDALPGSAAGPYTGAQAELACCLTSSPTERDALFVRRVAYRAPAPLSITSTPPVSPD